MEADKFEKYLKERYADQVEWYDDKSSQNKRCYQVFQWVAIVISASVPALIVAMPDEWKWLTAIPSTIVAIATTVLKTFKYQENWITYRTIAETLKREKHYYDAETIEYATAEDKEQLFVERVETLTLSENTLWITIQTKKEDKQETKKV